MHTTVLYSPLYRVQCSAGQSQIKKKKKKKNRTRSGGGCIFTHPHPRPTRLANRFRGQPARNAALHFAPTLTHSLTHARTATAHITTTFDSDHNHASLSSCSLSLSTLLSPPPPSRPLTCFCSFINVGCKLPSLPTYALYTLALQHALSLFGRPINCHDSTRHLDSSTPLIFALGPLPSPIKNPPPPHFLVCCGSAIFVRLTIHPFVLHAFLHLGLPHRQPLHHDRGPVLDRPANSTGSSLTASTKASQLALFDYARVCRSLFYQLPLKALTLPTALCTASDIPTLDYRRATPPRCDISTQLNALSLTATHLCTIRSSQPRSSRCHHHHLEAHS